VSSKQLRLDTQGSVLGPVLLLIFINDLDKNLCSSVLKFADDTKLFSRVDTSEEKDLLHRDLDYLLDWSDTWQMPFNVSKCQVMHLGKDNQEFEYFMGSHKLEVVKEGRDLGVQFVDNLKPFRQCQSAYSKACRVFGMKGRTISYKDADLLVRLYKSLVRPMHIWSIACQLGHQNI